MTYSRALLHSYNFYTSLGNIKNCKFFFSSPNKIKFSSYAVLVNVGKNTLKKSILVSAFPFEAL